ncbi:MAG: hypothetical protein ACOYNC_02100 [Bacteroidales bacterium]
MKHLVFMLATLLCLSQITAFGQSEECVYAFSLKTGTLLKNVTYGKKQEVISSSISKVIINDGHTLTFSTESYSNSSSAGGGTVLTDVICKDGEVLYPIDPGITGVKVSDNSDKYINFPVTMSQGMKLKDIVYSGKGITSDGYPFPVKMNQKERVVERVESITTPAGTFECAKVNYLLEYGPVKWQTSLWISKEVGIVKTEFYKKGKVVSSVVLEMVTK